MTVPKCSSFFYRVINGPTEQEVLEMIKNPQDSPMREEFNKILGDLNREKSALDKFNDIPDVHRYYENNDYMHPLKMKIKSRIENYSNAWLKLYEILNYIRPILRDKIVTIHVAELPGSMINSSHHWIYQNYPEAQHEWYAQSWINPAQKSLEDKYGLFKKYPSRWWIGTEEGLYGDLTDPEQVLYIERKAISVGKADIVTGDLGIHLDNNYESEEIMNMVPQFGQDLAALLSLKPGGLFITKHFTITNPFNVSWTILLSSLFFEFAICKPTSSRSRNSEIYFIGKQYLGMSAELREILLAKLKEFRTPNDKALFSSPLTEKQIFAISKSRKMNQVVYIRFLVKYINAMKRKDWSMTRDLKDNIQEASNLWLQNNMVYAIPQEKRLNSAIPQEKRSNSKK